MQDTATILAALDAGDEVPIAPETIRRLRSGEYRFLVDQGLLEGEHVELLEGFIVYKWPQDGSPQDGSHKIRRLRRREYDRLVEEGLLDGERVELLDGFIVNMSPQGSDHSWAARRLMRLLTFAVGDRAAVQGHSPLAVSEDAEPEPDVAVVPDGDWRAHPSTAMLVVEVANSSLQYDRGEKARVYAAASIPEYWIVNLADGVVEVFRAPLPEAGVYRDVSVRTREDSITLVSFPDVTIAVREFLPPR